MIDPSAAKALFPALRIVEPQAPRDPQLTQVIGRVLASGSDARIAIDAATGCNGYGGRPVPRPDVLAFSSSTASTISPLAFSAVEEAYGALFRSAANANFCLLYTSPSPRDS